MSQLLFYMYTSTHSSLRYVYNMYYWLLHQTHRSGAAGACCVGRGRAGWVWTRPGHHTAPAPAETSPPRCAQILSSCTLSSYHLATNKQNIYAFTEGWRERVSE